MEFRCAGRKRDGLRQNLLTLANVRGILEGRIVAEEQEETASDSGGLQ